MITDRSDSHSESDAAACVAVVARLDDSDSLGRIILRQDDHLGIGSSRSHRLTVAAVTAVRPPPDGPPPPSPAIELLAGTSIVTGAS